MLRKPHRSFVTIFSFLGILALLLTACGPSGTPTGATSGSSGGKPVRGGTWIDDLYEEPSSLVPNGSPQTYAALMDNAIWAPLFVGKPDGTIAPGIVSEMPTTANGDISADLKTWTFKLKPGLKWSDGQPLDARDVDYTWKLWNNPAFGAAITSGFNLIKSATVSSDNPSIATATTFPGSRSC
jgi:peptide/nickel transport system substrate-binding protein